MDPAWRGVTLELLLADRGRGPDQDWLLSSRASGAILASARRTPTDERRWLRQAVTALPPQHPPGTAFTYSNTTAGIVAGAMLEARTGKPWEQIITERLFRPLGIDSAGFGPPGTAARV
jgi:CubicO group peptidase (beta-lactamase class C family)